MALFPVDQWTLQSKFIFESRGIRFSPSGDLYCCERTTIQRIDAQGNKTCYAGIPGESGHTNGRRLGEAKFEFHNFAYGMCWDSVGDLYVAVSTNETIRRISGDTVTCFTGSERGYRDGTLSEALFKLPTDVVHVNNTLIVCDGKNQKLRHIDIAKGLVSTIRFTYAPSVSNFLQWPFSLNLSYDDSKLYVADIDSSFNYELDLATMVVSYSGKNNGSRSITSLPSGELIHNCYSVGLSVNQSGLTPTTRLQIPQELVGNPLLLYDHCLHLPTGRMALSNDQVYILQNVFEPYIEWSLPSAPYHHLRSENSPFPPDKIFTDSNGNAHPYHSYIFNLFPHLDDMHKSPLTQTILETDWIETKSSQLFQIGAEFPEFPFELLFDALYGSLHSLDTLIKQNSSKEIVMVARAFEILGFDTYPLQRMARSTSKDLLELFTKKQLIEPLCKKWDRLPLSNALLEAATAIKFVEGNFDSVVPPAYFILEATNINHVKGYIMVDKWLLYERWSWFKRLIDAGLLESKTGRTEVPYDLPLPLLLSIIRCCYAQYDLKGTKCMLERQFDCSLDLASTIPAILQESAMYAINQGLEVNLVDMDLNPTCEEFEHLLHWLQLLVDHTSSSPSANSKS